MKFLRQLDRKRLSHLTEVNNISTLGEASRQTGKRVVARNTKTRQMYWICPRQTISQTCSLHAQGGFEQSTPDPFVFFRGIQVTNFGEIGYKVRARVAVTGHQLPRRSPTGAAIDGQSRLR